MASRVLVLLYGPPASGKDTVTHALSAADSRCILFPRLKHGPGRTSGYRMVDLGQLEAVRATPGEVLWENDRYESTYVVDRSHLETMFAAGLVPVVHLGQAAAVETIVRALPDVTTLVVALTCPREVALERIEGRFTGDTEARLIAYDLTEPLASATLTIDTSTVLPDQAAKEIATAIAVLQ